MTTMSSGMVGVGAGPSASRPTHKPRVPSVPIAPIQAWCNEQVAAEGLRQGVPQNWRGGSVGVRESGPCDVIAARLGINARVLNRIKRGRYAGSQNNRKGEYPTEWIGRAYIEDMLWRAGVDFYDVYPELEGERNVELEEDGFCKQCHEFVTPIGGLCPWDDTPVDRAGRWLHTDKRAA